MRNIIISSTIYLLLRLIVRGVNADIEEAARAIHRILS